MPTYDYKCEACDHSLDVFQKINDEPLKACPACNKEALKRGIGGGAAIFRFVGEGFYINDSKPGTKENCSSGGCNGKKCGQTS